MINGMLVVDAAVHAANAARDNVAPAIQPMAEPLLDLVQGYGFPPLTEEAKRKILGENYCRLHGLDFEDVKTKIGDDGWARRRTGASSREPWSTIRPAPPLGAEA